MENYRYLYIGEYKLPLNNNYDDKCDYLKSLQIKKQNELQNIEKIKKDFVNDKVLIHSNKIIYYNLYYSNY